jgi:hypothetical protein
MISGQVDARLLIAITSLVPIHPLDILAFGGSARGASPGVPLCSLTMAENGGAAVVRRMIASLRTQHNAPYVPYRAPRIETAQRDGQPVMIIEFGAPVPLGLINGPNP